MNRRYHYSFAELCDRLQIAQLKEIYSENKTAFRTEIGDILHDIDEHLDEKKIDALTLRAIMVMAMVNISIWDNEDAARGGENKYILTLPSDGSITTKEIVNAFPRVEIEPLSSNLEKTHKLNYLRSIAKTQVQNRIGGRTDPKLNVLGQGQTPIWDIMWHNENGTSGSSGRLIGHQR